MKARRPFLDAGGRVAGSVLACAAAVVLAGCGTYRPVVSAINPVGPATQPVRFAVVVGKPTDITQPGTLTIVDGFAETVLVSALLSPNPSYFAYDGADNFAYVLHPDGLLDAFQVSSALRTENITQSSLAQGSNPVTLNPFSTFVYVSEQGSDTVSVLRFGAAPTLVATLPLSAPPPLSAANPDYVITNTSAPRIYALSEGATPGTSTGIATPIEVGTNLTNVLDPTIAVGVDPVYGVLNTDNRRAYVMNKGDGTVSVIDTTKNTLDNFTNQASLGTITVGSAPLWADIANSINELAVVNSGDDSLSIINITLCNQAQQQGTVSGCDPLNSVDSANFGQVLATVPTGTSPVMVAVDQGFNKAYVANKNNGNGTVSVIDLTTLTKIKDIQVGGTLNWIAVTSGTPTGKAFVTASDTQVMTIIDTQTDVVRTTIPIGANGLSVRVSAP